VKKAQSIFYIGELWDGGTCLDRMKTLQRMGHEVIPFDTTPFVADGLRIFRSLAHRTNFGPPVWGLNEALLSRVKQLKRLTLVWVDKGRWIYPETLDKLRAQTGASLVHYTPDAQLWDNKSRYFNAYIPLYDLVVTTKPFEAKLYKAAGAREVLLVLQGYGSRFGPLARAASEKVMLQSDVCFIGHCQRHYAARLQVAAHTGARLRIWGRGWCRYTRFHSWAREHVAGDGIWGEQYPIALASSKIALGLLSKRIPETTTTRTFEIPATGAFLLAERTDDHLALFREGIEAEFFESDEELQEKIHFYLKNDNTRRKIAAAGRERCVSSRYDAKCQIEKVLTHL